MRNPEICKVLLERLLPDVDVEEVRNTNESSDDEILQNQQNLLFSIEPENALDLDPITHGVRFDALMKSTQKWAEVEMQTYIGAHIGKRLRYYLSNVDMEAFAKGETYSTMLSTYIIILNTKCNPKLLPKQLNALYDYINNLSRFEDEFIQRIEERVQQYNSKKAKPVSPNCGICCLSRTG